MSYKPSDPYSKQFTTASPSSGAAANADSLPTATADFVGTGTGAMALTVASVSTGLYRITGTIPAGRVRGDVLNVSVAATVGGVAGKACVDTQVLDSKRVGELNDLGGVAQTGDAFTRVGAAGAGLTALGDARLANLDAAVSTRSTYAGGPVASVTAPTTLAPAGVDNITIEAGINLRQAVSLVLAALAGKASGLNANAPVFKGANGTTTRISATTDASGNRTAVTLSPPS